MSAPTNEMFRPRANFQARGPVCCYQPEIMLCWPLIAFSRLNLCVIL